MLTISNPFDITEVIDTKFPEMGIFEELDEEVQVKINKWEQSKIQEEEFVLIDSDTETCLKDNEKVSVETP